MNRFSAAILEAPRAVTGEDGLVSSQHRAASETGAEVLRAGGSAVDAAVATALALGVVEPWMSGVGGVGYLVIGRIGEEPEVIDFSARSPAAVRPGDYPTVGGVSGDLFAWERVKDDRNVKGALSVCAPTLVPGLELAWLRHGILPWKDLLSPVRQLAADGVPIDWYTQLMIGSAASDLQSDPDAAAVYLNADGSGKSSTWTAATSQKLDQTRLADTLDEIARSGARTCVDGDIAQALVSDVNAKGGVLSLTDFLINQPKVARPLTLRLPNGQQIWTVDGLSGGAAVADMLRSWRDAPSELTHTQKLSHRALSGVAMLKDRLDTMGDSGERAAQPSCTTSFCVVDKTGLVVAATLTLVSIFGSKLLSPCIGVLLNNAMSWFDPAQGKPNSIRPASSPLSNMAPTLLSSGKDQLTAFSAAGGRRIAPAISQVAADVALDGFDLEDALSHPRFDFRGDGVVIADTRMSTDVTKQLAGRVDLLTAEPTVFPYHFGLVTAAQYTSSGNGFGFCEAFCPNAETVAA